jgi:molecular chaperone DnaK
MTKLSVLLVLAIVLVAACSGAGTEAASTATGQPATTASTRPTTTTGAVTVTTEAPVRGSGWGRVPHDEAVFGGAEDQEMRSVAAVGPGLVAVGYDTSGGDQDAAVWTSSDGFAWTRVAHDEAVFGGTGDQEMESVAAAGSGLVAVGWDGSGGDQDAAVWTSFDGLTWTRVAHDEAVFGGEDDQLMWAVTANNLGLVAVGDDWSGFDRDAAVWTSADGVAWSRVLDEEAVFSGSRWQTMESVAAVDSGLVAVGDDASGGDQDAAVWTSPDGLTWSRVPHDEAVFGGANWQTMRSVVATSSGLVAVGHDNWDAAVWISPDAVTWARVPHDEDIFGGDYDQVMRSVVAVGSGLVAVGFDNSGGDDDAAVWNSPDGVTWIRVPHDEAVLGGTGRQEMRSVVAVGSGLVAVGYDTSGGDRDAAVWYWTASE